MRKCIFLSTRAHKLVVSSCFVLLCTTVNASSVLAAGKNSISLQKAITKTIQHNPDLRAFDFQLKAQEGKVQQSKIAPAPEVSIELEDALGTGNYKGLKASQTTFSIAWLLERGIRQFYINSARAGSALLMVEADIKQLDAAAETARRYLVSLAYQARLINTDKTIELAKETINAVERRVNAGKTPEAELTRAQVELVRRKLEREFIEHEQDAANRLLAAQWGQTTPNFTQVEGDIFSVPQIASFESLKSNLQKNPEFARLLSDKRVKKSVLALEQARAKPSWQVKTGARHFITNNDLAFVAGISIPFGERTRNTGRIAEVRAALDKTEKEKQATQVRIETTLYVLHKRLLHRLHVLEVLRNEIIPPLQQAQKETRRAYSLGRYSYLEWRSVQAELLDAQNALIEASIEAHQNIIEIERLTGVRIVKPTNMITQEAS